MIRLPGLSRTALTQSVLSQGASPVGLSRIAAVSAAVGLAGLGAGAVSHLATKRWSENPDPTRGSLFLLSGHGRTVVGHDGVELQVYDQGSGHAVVLTPSWTGCAADWAPVVHELAGAGYRVVVYDRRGHGRSTLGESGFTITNMGLDLRTVIEGCDLTDATVVGHSLGGIAAMVFSIDHGPAALQRVRNMVLVAASARWSMASSVASTNLVVPVRGTGFDHRPVARTAVGSALIRSLFGADPNLRLLRHGAARFAELAPKTLLDLLELAATLDISDQLQSISHPVRVVCGSDDRVTPLADSEVLEAHIPFAELHTINGAGHMIPWERPAAIVDAVRMLEPAGS